MLTGASEYVCEARILKRLSGEIEANLERLETEIASLKKEFPGKFPKSLSPDSSLSKIRDVATMLKGDDADKEANCRSGDLGNKLNAGTLELREILRDTLDTLGGKVVRYSFTDRIADFRGKIKPSLSPLASYTGKAVLATLLVAISSFVYLSLTMESEDALLSSIKDDLAFVEEQKGAITRQRQEYREIRGNIKSLQGKELAREGKIELLNLSKKEREIKEFIDLALVAIENKEREIAEKYKKIEEIRKKSFLQKLVRR
jgi:hypothetical protein